MIRDLINKIREFFVGPTPNFKQFEYRFLRLYSELLTCKKTKDEALKYELLIRFEGLLLQFLKALGIRGLSLRSALETDEAGVLFGKDREFLVKLASYAYKYRVDRKNPPLVKIDDIIKGVEIVRKLWKDKIK